MLVAYDGGVATCGAALGLHDDTGAPTGELDAGGDVQAAARFGDGWLALTAGGKGLVHLDGEERLALGAGKGAIDLFVVGKDQHIAIARGESLELWTPEGKRRWTTKGGPFVAACLARDHVVALAADGALVFYSQAKGDALGALRLASPEAPTEWRLAAAYSTIVVLALGEWLVWVDASTRKTVRRVRARAKVEALAADSEHVVAVVEEGFVQAFRASSGEPRASFSTNDATLVAIALGKDSVYTLDVEGVVRVADRQTLDVTTKASAPVTALAARGDLAAAGDRAGKVRVLEGAREIGAVIVGEATTGVHVTRGGTVIAAGARVMMRSQRPFDASRPIALRAAPTAFAADDAYAFAGTQSGSIDVYDLEAGRHVTTYTLSSDDRITALVRLAGASLVVGTGALDGRVLVVDVAESKVVHRISPHEEAFGVTCLAADARGRIVASGSDDSSIALLDPAKGRVLARLRVNETPVSLAFEPSGRRLACVFADGTAALVTLAKSASVTDLGLRGATHVAWGEGPIVGFRDGRAERVDAIARTTPSNRPLA